MKAATLGRITGHLKINSLCVYPIHEVVYKGKVVGEVVKRRGKWEVKLKNRDAVVKETRHFALVYAATESEK